MSRAEIHLSNIRNKKDRIAIAKRILESARSKLCNYYERRKITVDVRIKLRLLILVYPFQACTLDLFY
jgi:hypothetical protein